VFVIFGSLSIFRGVKSVLLMVAATTATLAALGICLSQRLTDNVHVIESGLAYRSAQLWPGELELVVEDYGIRSIISLVPPAPDQYWYRGEEAVSSARGIVRYEMPLSADSELSLGQLRDLLTLLRKAPKPVLIHSRTGADRSGLAAAIFKYAIASRSIEEAESQLSIRYGHIPNIWTGTDAMDASFKRFLASAETPRTR
jgi:protein tyrosine/serine phosphatase